MRRIERPPWIYYVCRPVFRPLICLACSLALFGLAVGLIRGKGPGGAVWNIMMWGAFMALVGLGMLLRVRGFAVNPSQGELVVIDRHIFGGGGRRILPLASLSVTRVTNRAGDTYGGGLVHTVWIEIPGGPAIFFLQGRRGAEVADRLAADLGCPLRVADRR